MRQDEFEDIERKLAEDRGRYYRGTARIRFEHLYFGDLCPRDRDDKIVEYLKDKFNGACLRLEPKHRIPAVIGPQTLEAAIDSSPEITLEKLLDNPSGLPPELKLPPGCQVECLHGRQRFEAAKEILPPKDWWWTVDLYIEGATSTLLADLSQEYSDSINFSDGEIYQKICQHRESSNQTPDTLFAEKRLWSRLTKSKRRDLKQFLKNSRLTAGFNALRVLPSLLADFRIGHKLLALKCDEEIVNYFNYILQVWSTILGGSRDLMRCTDRGTVSMLQLRAPGLCQEDLVTLEKPFRAGTIFPAIRDEHHRREIWNNLKNQKRLIPSLWSLFEDVKFLKGSAKIMRRLFPKSSLTTYQAAERIFTGRHQRPDEVVLQSSEQSFRSVKMPSVNQFKIGYWQLWLFTWRHFTKLGHDCPRKEEGEETPQSEEPDRTLWHWFGVLADKIGFESDHINEMVSSDPDKENASKALVMGRCPQHFTYDQVDFDRFQHQIISMYRNAKPIANTAVQLALLTDQPGEELQRRCGRAFRRSYESYRTGLFFEALHSPKVGRGTEISAFYVRASIFVAFFVQGADSDLFDAEMGNRRLSYGLKETGASETNNPSLENNHQASPINSTNADKTIATNIENMGATNVPQIRVSEYGQATLANPVDDQGPTNESPKRVSVRTVRGGDLQAVTESIPMARSEVERFASKQRRKNIIPVNKDGRALSAGKCYDTLLDEGSETIILVPLNEFPITHPLLSSLRLHYIPEKDSVGHKKHKAAVDRNHVVPEALWRKTTISSPHNMT